jgi:lysophospholipase L1-like esterase
MMSRRFWAKVGLLTLVGAATPSCGTNNVNEGPRSPVGGTAGTPGSAGTPATSAGTSNGGTLTGGTASGGVAGGTIAGGATNGGATAGADTGGTSTGPWTFPAGVTKPKIMIVGDSISAGPGCYKKFLAKDLKDNNYTNLEFVGEYTDDCGGGIMHSAVSCSTAEQYTLEMFMVPNCTAKTYLGMAPLMAKHKPDLVMLQLGVNDVWGGKTTENILSNYAKLIEQARAQNPRIVLVVARIQKIRPDCSADEAITKRAEALVNAVPAWAALQSKVDSPVFVADLWTNSDWSKTETIDCVHPNDVGAERMGMNWYNALKGILKPG